MPSYAHHVLEAIQHTTNPISIESIIEFVTIDRTKHNHTKTSERHIKNAINKLIKAKIINKVGENLYCMIDTSPQTKTLPKRKKDFAKQEEKKQGVNNGSGRKRQITAYNVFTKHFIKENKKQLKRNVLAANCKMKGGS